jgi:hypothetical protein
LTGVLLEHLEPCRDDDDRLDGRMSSYAFMPPDELLGRL